MNRGFPIVLIQWLDIPSEAIVLAKTAIESQFRQ